MRSAAAAGALLAAVLCGPPAAAARERWVAPAPGAVTRAFHFSGDPFAPGLHRGLDLAAAPGAAVRAPCSGPVVVAGRVGASGGVVTIRCGRWRVSLLPLAAIRVRAGAVVARGEGLGRAGRAAGHAGVHLGVRREGSAAGYVDPQPFLRAPSRPPPPAGPRPGTRRIPPHRPPPLLPPGSLPAAPRSAPARAPAPSPVRPPAPALAPWPAWAGLALLLAGAAGAGVRLAPRRRGRSAPRAIAQEVR